VGGLTSTRAEYVVEGMHKTSPTIEKGRMHKNPKFYSNSVQTNALGNFLLVKNTFKQGELEANTF